MHFPTLEIAGVGVEPTSNGAGSPHACAGWATEAPVRMEAVRGHSPGGGPVVGRTCIKGCGHKGVGHLMAEIQGACRECWTQSHTPGTM